MNYDIGLELLMNFKSIRLVKVGVAKRSEHDDTKVINQLNEDHFRLIQVHNTCNTAYISINVLNR